MVKVWKRGGGSCKCWSCCACWRHSRFGMRKEFSINFNFKSTPCRRLQPESAMASSVIILAFRCVVCSIFPSPSLSFSLYLVLFPSVCLALACSQLSESMRCRDALALSFKPAQLLADSLSSWLDTGHLPVHTRVQRLQITRTWQAGLDSVLFGIYVMHI